MRRFRNQITLSLCLVMAAALILGANMLFAKSSDDNEVKVDKKAWLGIYMQDITEDIAEALDLEVEQGVLINDVIDDSPAEKSGLKDGDVIVRMDTEVVDKSGDLSKAIKSKKPGDKVDLVVFRDGQKQDISVVLGESAERKDRQFSLKAPKSGQYKKFFGDMVGGGYLGVVLQGLNEQLAEYFEVEDGVLVSEVEEDSPAAKAGLKAGDIIIAINGKEVESPSEVSSMIRKHEEGEKVDIDVVRKGSDMQFTAEIEEREFDQRWFGFFGEGENLPGIYGVPDPPHFQWHFSPDDFDFDFDSEEFDKMFGKEFGEEFREEMEELREELEELREELQDLKKEVD